MQHVAEIAILAFERPGSSFVLFHDGGKFPTAQVRLHVKLPFLQAPKEHVLEFSGIIVRPLPICHFKCCLDGIIDVAERQRIPLRAIFCGKIVVRLSG